MKSKASEFATAVMFTLFGACLYYAFSIRSTTNYRLAICADQVTSEVLENNSTTVVQDYLGLPSKTHVNLNMAEAYVDHLTVQCILTSTR